VSGTSSESDADYDGFKLLNLSQVRWTPKLEVTLEEILIRSQFDFKCAAKEFERFLNKNEQKDKSAMFKVDGKTLQLRWTDIEIRRHVIPKMIETNRLAEEVAADDDEDLAPFEEKPYETSTKLIDYDEGSSGSDAENRLVNTGTSSGLDLEELD
jgi:hypothetical protein